MTPRVRPGHTGGAASAAGVSRSWRQEVRCTGRCITIRFIDAGRRSKLLPDFARCIQTIPSSASVTKRSTRRFIADVDHLLLTTAQTSPSQLVLDTRHCGPFSYERGDMLYGSQKCQPQGSDQLVDLWTLTQQLRGSQHEGWARLDRRTALRRYDNVSVIMQGSM